MFYDEEEDKQTLGEEERNKTEEKEDRDEDIYSDESREEMMDEEDEITDVDEGFMKGYGEGEKAAVCANCGRVLDEDFVEQEFHDEMYRFCSSDCANEYAERKTVDAGD